MMGKQYKGRSFLAKPPYLTAVSWSTQAKFDDHFVIPHYFSGKFTLVWGGSRVRIHSYGEHGYSGADKFMTKCRTIITHIDAYIDAVQHLKHGSSSVFLNDSDTPHTGTVSWFRGEAPSGDRLSIFELASCRNTIRIHAANVGGEKSLCASLKRLKKQLEKLLLAAERVKEELSGLWA